MNVIDYFETAKTNEAVFRNVLRDLKKNSRFAPQNLQTELTLGEIFEKYSKGDRYGKFTILDFRTGKGIARISVEDIAILSGSGAELEYRVNEDNSVLYQQIIYNWMSFK